MSTTIFDRRPLVPVVRIVAPPPSPYVVPAVEVPQVGDVIRDNQQLTNASDAYTGQALPAVVATGTRIL